VRYPRFDGNSMRGPNGAKTYTHLNFERRGRNYVARPNNQSVWRAKGQPGSKAFLTRSDLRATLASSARADRLSGQMTSAIKQGGKSLAAQRATSTRLQAVSKDMVRQASINPTGLTREASRALGRWKSAASGAEGLAKAAAKANESAIRLSSRAAEASAKAAAAQAELDAKIAAAAAEKAGKAAAKTTEEAVKQAARAAEALARTAARTAEAAARASAIAAEVTVQATAAATEAAVTAAVYTAAAAAAAVAGVIGG
jgi:hypothetical protein